MILPYFCLKSDKAIDKPYGKVELLRREEAAIQFEPQPIDVPLLPNKVLSVRLRNTNCLLMHVF